ncbi:hypothetical protein FACS18949_02910 [Clostridia bacterium]|nr:hypothetical protein FACS18949_02910 [Clostridia bacterium]
MNEIQITPGATVQYAVEDNAISFRDGDLSLNLANRERDEENIIDICADLDGELVIGAAEGFSYVAQIKIPAREYTEAAAPETDDPDETGYGVVPEPKPFDISKCTINLWGGNQ